jgi:hypothetical protein
MACKWSSVRTQWIPAWKQEPTTDSSPALPRKPFVEETPDPLPRSNLPHSFCAYVPNCAVRLRHNIFSHPGLTLNRGQTDKLEIALITSHCSFCFHPRLYPSFSIQVTENGDRKSLISDTGLRLRRDFASSNPLLNFGKWELGLHLLCKQLHIVIRQGPLSQYLSTISSALRLLLCLSTKQNGAAVISSRVLLCNNSERFS